MATRIKTVEYWFAHLTTAADNTDTNFTALTVELPESSLTFRNVTLDVFFHDANTTLTGTCDRRQLSLQLAAVAYSAVNNTNSITLSGENYCMRWDADFTAYFTTNWTGTSMTCNARFLYDMSTAAPVGARNISAKLTITYEFDDTSTTQIKTVRLPLDAPVGALATSKPGSATASIPNLDQYLPEGGKTIIQTCFVVEGNRASTSTTDGTVTWQVDTDTAFTSQTYEEGGTQAMYTRLSELGAFTTNATHSWYLWGSVATCNHQQATLYVTYKFDAQVADTTLNGAIDASTTTVNVTSGADYPAVPYTLYVDSEQMIVTARTSNALTVTRGANGTTAASHSDLASIRPCTLISQKLGQTVTGPMGGATSSDYQRVKTDVWVPEPGPVGGQQTAFYLNWAVALTITGTNFRVGTGSFVSYTSGANVTAGGLGAMIRNDSAFTLARGRNAFTADFYRTDTQDLGMGTGGYWLVNYIAGKPSAGHGAETRSIAHTLLARGTSAVAFSFTIAAAQLYIPDTNYFLANVGWFLLCREHDATAGLPCVLFGSERLSGEGGIAWDQLCVWGNDTRPEVGEHPLWGGWSTGAHDQLSPFKRWTGDPDTKRYAITTARRWRVTVVEAISTNLSLQMWYTVHAVLASADGTVSGSGGGTVTVRLHRDSDGELLLSTTRSGNGTYAFDWFDSTEDLYVYFKEDSTHTGGSWTGKATLD